MTVSTPTSTVAAPFTTEEVEILQFSTAGLGDSTYLLRSGEEAAIIDPQRDVDRFRHAIAGRGARLVAVVETHLHNDYVSGGPALAREHGAPYVVPDGAGYELEHRAVRDGEEIRVGSVRLRAVHTPGHTAHHTAYAVLEGSEVRALFSGGSVLVGACGRTDLISPQLTEPLARDQYRSAQLIGRLPGPTAIGPTHGAGSFCSASAAGNETWTTVERERLRNPAYLARDEDDFVRTQLAGLPAYPAYYRRMAPINRRGATAWEAASPPRIGPAQVGRLGAGGAVVVDLRPRRRFAEEHVAGAISVELDPQFGTYLGWLFPFGTRFVLVADPDQDTEEAARQLGRIGLETIAGVIGIAEWREAGGRAGSCRVADIDELRLVTRSGGVRVLDVRQDTEWGDGHVPGAHHVHVADLPARVAELRGEEPVYVYCQSGYRAMIGASILAAAGITAVAVEGGFPAWRERGYPVE